MREIKFRAWDIEANDWAYGTLNIKRFRFDIKCDIYGQLVEGYGIDGLIKEETMSEYTGCKDVNGVEIYEGDIVKVTDLMPCEKYYGKTYICKIVYDKDRFIIENYLGSGSNRIAEKESFNFKSIEVIGNVFENEELLEVKSYERD